MKDKIYGKGRHPRLERVTMLPALFSHYLRHFDPRQGCISCGTCSYPELTEDHVLTSAYVKVFRIVTRNAANKSFWRKKDCSWPPLKQICNEYLMKFSENQSAPKLENRKTSPCSPCAPNLLHVLMSRTTGYHNLCSPDILYVLLVVKVFARAHDKISECPAFRGYVAKESLSQKQTPHIRRNCKRTVFLEWKNNKN